LSSSEQHFELNTYAQRDRCGKRMTNTLLLLAQQLHVVLMQFLVNIAVHPLLAYCKQLENSSVNQIKMVDLTSTSSLWRQSLGLIDINSQTIAIDL